MKRYTFTCIDTDTNTNTEVSFDTECDLWSTYDGPMWKFFDFLKGCGFVFGTSDEIGVLTKKGNFRAASEDFSSYYID